MFYVIQICMHIIIIFKGAEFLSLNAYSKFKEIIEKHFYKFFKIILLC